MGKNKVVELSDSYKASRRNAVLFSAVGLSWSIAQFELNQISTGSLTIDLTSTAFPALLSVLLAYLSYRLVFDFAMQDQAARIWRLAQIDFEVTYGLTRLTIVLLAASTVSRSFYALLISISAIITFIAAYWFATALLTLLLMPAILFWKEIASRKPSAARSAIEAVYLSEIISGLFLSIAISVSIYFILKTPAISSHIKGPIPLSSTVQIILATVLIYLSVFFYRKMTCFLFCDDSPAMLKAAMASAIATHDAWYEVGDNYYEFDESVSKSPYRRRK